MKTHWYEGIHNSFLTLCWRLLLRLKVNLSSFLGRLPLHVIALKLERQHYKYLLWQSAPSILHYRKWLQADAPFGNMHLEILACEVLKQSGRFSETTCLTWRKLQRMSWITHEAAQTNFQNISQRRLRELQRVWGKSATNCLLIHAGRIFIALEEKKPNKKTKHC